MEFNTRLKQLRLDNNLTQRDLANMLGVKPTAISNYESQRNEPSFDKLIALSKYFEVSCDYLLGITDSYLPIGGEILDSDILDLFDMYQQMNQEHVEEFKNYGKYLLYKQGHCNNISEEIYHRLSEKIKHRI